MLQDLSNHMTKNGQSLARTESSLGEQRAATRKIRLALFSSGLGRINRGFEISTARFHKAIAGKSKLDARLFAGAEYPGATQVACIGRNQWLESPLKVFSFVEREKLWKFAYVLEQISYAFGLIPESRQNWQPDVVWTKEVPLAHVLYEFRKLSDRNYKIIFANGGGFKPSTYQQFDFIQHLQPEAYKEALEFGISPEKMTVIPNVVPNIVPSGSRAELRDEFGYKESDWIIVCASAWNSHHKRLDYLINEVAALNHPDCRLLICGQPEPEGLALQELASSKLGSRARFLTVPEGRVQDLFAMSDLFVLCSLYEGLGAVLIEAALSGLPVLCHPHGGSRFILDEDPRWLLDMSQPGNLSCKLKELKSRPFAPSDLAELKKSVQTRFCTDKLASEFESMVKRVFLESGSLK